LPTPLSRGGEEESHGYKGKGSLIHLLADKNSKPLAITTTGAGGNERTEVEKLLLKTTILHKRSLAGRLTILETDKKIVEC